MKWTLKNALVGTIMMAAIGCGSDSPSSSRAESRTFANQHWDPVAYMEWRTSTRASRFSSITHALPCSSLVAYGGDIAANIKGCGALETAQYYDLIGKYNQFIAGWNDVVRTDSNSPVQPTDIDSVESFSSQHRLQYEAMR